MTTCLDTLVSSTAWTTGVMPWGKRAVPLVVLFSLVTVFAVSSAQRSRQVCQLSEGTLSSSLAF